MALAERRLDTGSVSRNRLPDPLVASNNPVQKGIKAMKGFWLRRCSIGRVALCIGHNPDIDLSRRSQWSARHDSFPRMRAFSLRVKRVFVNVDITA